MEKIININFQGRIIPIEETAYGGLKQYLDGLRSHFAHEEGYDEIINDIENRIAELLSYRLKQGAPCINVTDVNNVIASIGRLEDIAAAESDATETPPPPPNGSHTAGAKGRFCRNADDKVIAGVCSGIANRMGVDPLIVRVVFVLLFGALFPIYILLWMIVPSESVETSVTRRLYRNVDDKMVAGVCGGLAAYLRIDSWILRLIFGLPLLAGLLSSGLYAFWWNWHWGFGPHIFTGTFGGALLALYVILWISVPYATSATDRLEMRGEKVDIHSLRSAQSRPAPARNRSGLGRVIAILFKAFFLVIAGSIAIALFCTLIGLGIAGFALMPFTAFFLEGWGQYALAWGGIILVLGIPFLALATWIVRRLIGVRTRSHFFGYFFAILWVAGFFGLIALASVFFSDFSTKNFVEETIPVTQPATGRLWINVDNTAGTPWHNYRHRWFYDDGMDDAPFRIISPDSLWLNTVKVKVTRSADSLYHVYETRSSRGSSAEEARNLAAHISFSIAQHDSTLTLPGGFTISRRDKFRNQQVIVLVEVPLGKEIRFARDLTDYTWFNINVNHSSFDIDNEWSGNYHYRSNREYIMTPAGLRNIADTARTIDEDDDER